MTTFRSLILCLQFSLAMLPVTGFSEERKGKAVYEISVKDGMKLTEKALKNIEVRTFKLKAGSDQAVPPESLVYFSDQVGVYRLRLGWFKLVQVQVLSKNNKDTLIRSSEFQSGDELVVRGAELLRVSELDAAGGVE